MKKRLLVSALLAICFGLITEAQQPNIVVIMTDQQRADMMSCTGNEWLKTPGLDKLAGEGVRFEKAYATNPVCVPSRFSIQTSRYPSSIEMRHNDSKINRDVHDELIRDAMGHIFRESGYETFYGGKVHLPNSYDDATSYGYTMISKDHRDELANESARFLRNRGKDDEPFLLFVSFINPHDICYMALRQLMPGSWYDKNTPDTLFSAMELPEGISEEELLQKYLPPLPDNFEPTEGEPEGNKKLLELRAYRKKLRDTWSEKDWRLHRWTYHRLTEYVDGQIGMVLDALDQSDVKDNTIVLFTSDHGEMAGSHRLEHKSFFYEESVRIPLIMAGKGIKAGVVDSAHLINNGLDILPTLCDLAGIDPPPSIEGKSFAPLVEKKPVYGVEEREYVFVENQVGFMVTNGRYKYMYFDDESNGEMLIDLEKDPGEMRNVINEKRYQSELVELRKVLFNELKRRELM